MQQRTLDRLKPCLGGALRQPNLIRYNRYGLTLEEAFLEEGTLGFGEFT